jgi:cell division protein FtsQ
MIALALVLVFLYAFSSQRHTKRKLQKVAVKFTEGDNLFISENLVNKLLIQKKEGVRKVYKETLDLNELEAALNANEMIQNAQVYVSVDGVLGATIKQRTPIARVLNGESYYIDSNGLRMPLSVNRSARVPFVTGNISKDDISIIYEMADKIIKDSFLRKQVVSIHLTENKGFELTLRTEDLQVVFGGLELIDKKFNNLKAFFKKAQKDSTLNKYSIVNVQFDNQVVCTKK